MCFSLEVSLLAWAFSIAVAAILWNRNRGADRWNAAFICSFAMIQLWEAGMWYFGPGTKNANLLVAIISITLFIQPLVQAYGGYKYTNNKILKWATWLYLGLLAYAVYRLFTVKFASGTGPGCHLEWYASDGQMIINPPILAILYFIGLVAPLVFIWKQSWVLLLIAFATFAWAMRVTRGSNEFGSMWCLSAVTYSAAALFM